MKYNSQIGQDKFVIEQLKGKKNGVFIDIGGAHPTDINNTYTLENELDWRGLSFDIGPPYSHGCESMSLDEYKDFWSSNRTTPIICGDALTQNYSQIFKDNNLPKHMDYLTIDLEPPRTTLDCLLLIPFDEYIFNVITFETDYYRDTSTREPSREFLTSHGYKLVMENNQEDWYVHNTLKI